ncbi:synaptosomal-associated protein 47-like isoform X1 [Centruroides sculpturatus]|uniref:synaptosomal-associated protein 47-like isoform X1 n=1 Tax=Centruroides sculpturatus TaxID=218467 RepID=UPI000C6EAABD|nr:synaptosomal-associated protein 47-like isoform X1 [Centruroides sculpturatus]XP_023213194.1 synaptosomal-associated protein 47-like isoform X1 [Centruroides sculpturatus]XP_023213195.1 synaptosomal-associated protein 47-like isoform X1 [Centruroides sculpturatus]XP_023213196.1 synaptosomal-associated protein 47-like isoform X1 [Centruroides sculpturatus]XP_023231920.1 synaptosomal-associated protein 47-like isoform X1 [Centruroides sculpturatus]XP_023231922.1 synaptosomal-associated protei
MDEDQEQSYILQTSSSYYNSKIRKWNNGVLILKEDRLEFYENEVKDNHLCLEMLLDDISLIQRKNSSFIFGSIVITSGNTNHWFASFYNRDSVFNVLYLFWNHNAICGRYSESKLQLVKGGKSELGKDLLRLAQESEKTLAATALTLNHQGKQLDHAADIIDKINSDLTIAEKLLGLMSWTFGLNQSQSSSCKKKQEIADAKLNQYPVVYCLDKYSPNQNIWLSGILEKCNNGLKLYNDKFKLIKYFNKDDVNYIQIISSWELQICYEDEDTSNFMIKCPSLLEIRTRLISLFSDRLKFSDNVFPWNKSPSESCSPITTWNPCNKETDKQVIKTMTRGELEELNAAISQLKSLAVEVGIEQTNQMEKIDGLLQCVNSTDIRIKQDVKSIKKLT